MKVVVASENRGKIRELQNLLSPLAWELAPQSEFGVKEIEETGLTFIENALLKARHAASVTGLAAISDDSGLIIPAIEGAPGLYSARFAGKNASSQDNIEKVLKRMAPLADEKRSAFFYSVILFLKNAKDPKPLIGEGFWFGTILKTPRGDQGFGYDPIFFDSNEKKSAAELPLTLKNNISHRGQAIRSLIENWYASTNNQKSHQSLS